MMVTAAAVHCSSNDSIEQFDSLTVDSKNVKNCLNDNEIN